VAGLLTEPWGVGRLNWSHQGLCARRHRDAAIAFGGGARTWPPLRVRAADAARHRRSPVSAVPFADHGILG